MSAGDDRTVIARLHDIDAHGFDVRLYEQEANLRGARVETVSFIAWEPSVGDVNGVRFAVARTGETLSDQPRPLQFEPAFGRPPVFIADFQTTNGGDPANLRGHELSATGLLIAISEEQSLDTETSHSNEAVGYLSLAIASKVHGRRAGVCSKVAGPSDHDRLAQNSPSVIIEGCDATPVDRTVPAKNLKAEESKHARCQCTGD